MSFFSADCTPRQARFIERLLAERVVPAELLAPLERRGYPTRGGFAARGVADTFVELLLSKQEAAALIEQLLRCGRK